MQAIQTKFLPCTNTRGSRIKAWCDRGSITVSYPHGIGFNDLYAVAVRALIEKFCAEDLKEHGTPPADNPWNRPMVRGGLPGNHGEVFVYVDKPAKPLDFPKGDD